ncbi:extracellular solute-binding protein [Clostridium sp. BNL1100]|uniref:ABC transporter substrate-binding protein n=1 Tax=Clostridium sp. BNL1100 TaxID=755731 RepID=UPI00024A72E9|nr:extracellular solute-binding protein [Clostridium sp. BNL1100]AEY67234.1 ABC-type sugar transport system, periplasmic component [Clostridium sp. BNL1100]
MLKKKWTIFIAASMLITMLAGCGGNSGESSQTSGVDSAGKTTAQSDKPVVLKFWGGVPAEYGPQLTVDAFNKEYKDKGIQAEYIRFVNDDTGNMKLDTTLLAGGDIDVFMTYTSSNLVKRGTGGMALEISDRLSKAGFDPVKELGNSVNPYIYDGKVYGLPTKMENYYILANKNMFDEAGIPLPESWTYDEFRETAKKLTKGEGQNKVYGMYWNTIMEIFRPSYIAQTVLGPDFLYKAGGKETNLDNPEFIKLNQMISDMMWVDKSAVTHTDNVTQKLSVESVFLAGKSAMSLGVWTIRSIKDLEKYPHDFVTAYLPVPVSDNSAAKYSIGEGAAGDFICINPNSENIDKAMEFVTWYTKGGMLSMTPYGRVPMYQGIDSNKIVDEYMKNGEKILDKNTVVKFLEKKDNLAVSTETKKLPEIQKVFNDALESIYTGKKDAASALSEAKISADKFLK